MSKQRVELTAEKLRTLLSYDPATGEFCWLVKAARNTIIGSRAGTFTSAGYLMIRLLNKQSFYGHRLAWLYVMGEWPTDEIDHIDGNPANNRWANLRPADRTENGRNTCRPRHNTSGVKGVCWDKQRSKWRAYIVVRQRQQSLGTYDTKAAAANAYAVAANRIFGTFAEVSR